MKRRRSAGVREAKARLSEYLRRVKGGETVLITDRGTIIAELRAPAAAMADSRLSADERQLAELVVRGVLRAPARKARLGAFRGLGLKTGTARRTLDELREDR